jgi:NADPH:quinone reductase-like Zn-dependent oxidoreductase
MYAAVLDAIGRTPRYGTFPAPEAGDGNKVVVVTAAALKPSDRLMAQGAHYAPTSFPVVVGLDGVGRLEDGTRVAFFAPQRPYGGMAERALVRDGVWFPVPDAVDDVTAAAFTNPGMAAWKTLAWEGELVAGQTVLILGASGTSGRIAARLAVRQGARVVAAGRNQEVLDRLGADAVLRVDRPPDELTETIAAAGPYDLIVDYLWGPPAEAVFAALTRDRTRRTRYIQVGITAGAVAGLPALALRGAGLRLMGSGTGRPLALADAASAYDDLLRQVAAGEIEVAVDPVPLADVERAWRQEGDRRVVFVP